MMVSKTFDAGFEYFTQIDNMFLELNKDDEKIDKFTSGFLSIDFELSGGGCRRGEIYAFIALPGVGKSLALVKAAVENVKKGYKVVFVSVEMDWVSISKRFTSAYACVPYAKLMSKKDEIKQMIEYDIMNFSDKNRLVVKQFPAGTIDVNDIRAYLNQLELHGFVPDMLIVDYPGEMKDAPGVPVWESKYRIIRDLRGLACEKKMVVFTAMQPNKSASELSSSEFIEEGNIGASFDMFKPLDGLWSINRTTDEAGAQVGRVFVVKHRNGKSRYHFPIEYNNEFLTITEIDFENCSLGLADPDIDKIAHVMNSSVIGKTSPYFLSLHLLNMSLAKNYFNKIIRITYTKNDILDLAYIFIMKNSIDIEQLKSDELLPKLNQRKKFLANKLSYFNQLSSDDNVLYITWEEIYNGNVHELINRLADFTNIPNINFNEGIIDSWRQLTKTSLVEIKNRIQ
jgi:hypothetical protein